MKTVKADALPPFEQQTRLQTAGLLLREGRTHEGIAALRVLITLAPRLVDAHRLLGVALLEVLDLEGAAAAFRVALRWAPAEARAAVGLAEALLGLGRAAEAVAVLKPFVNGQTSNLSLLTYYGLALQAIDRSSEAVEILGRATVTSPDSAVAEHNFAGALVANKQFAQAESAVVRARAKGLDAAELWLVQARAARGQGDLKRAELLYAEAVERKPDYILAIVELAQTVWMKSEDIHAAIAILDEGSRRVPSDLDFYRHRAKLQEETGDHSGAYATLQRALAMKDEANMQIFAAQIAARTDPALALLHATHALEMQPTNVAGLAALCQANLALGRADDAAKNADELCRRVPLDQYSWALMGTAWRMLDDPRYGRLFDYQAMVSASRIDTPEGWSSLDAYLADLREALQPLHGRRGHPVGQSMRGGSQTEQDLIAADSPVVRAFFQAVDGPIRRHIAALGKGRDPLRGRIRKTYALSGAWSVRLRAQGFHVDHVHPEGWLSSACHIELPASLQKRPEGWLKFGEPGVPTAPRLEPDHFVKPELGQLVLFPSYMWHGTVPFSGETPRLSVAFDIVPA